MSKPETYSPGKPADVPGTPGVDHKWRAERTLDHLKSLVEQSNEGARDSSRSFYQTITTMAAGAIALSLTFMEKIAPKQPRQDTDLVVWSWVCFALSLLFITLAFRQFASDRERETQRMNDWVYKLCFGTMEGKDAEEALGPPSATTPSKVSTYLAYGAILLLCLGVALLVRFASVNIS